MAAAQPHRAEHLPHYSETCLQALVDHGLAGKISPGGAFGQLHHAEAVRTWYVGEFLDAAD